MPATKYTKEVITEAVKESKTLTEVLRKLGHPSPYGGMVTYIKGRITAYGIDSSHLLGNRWSLGIKYPGRGFTKRLKSPNEILIVCPPGKRVSSRLLRRAMVESGFPYKCVCGQEPIWKGYHLTIEVDHIDGDPCNNLLSNLRFLCPNCHSQTPTFRSKNRRVPPVEAEGPINLPAEFNSQHADKGRGQKDKIVWPSKEQLVEMTTVLPLSQIAEALGVSSPAVKKRCIRLGISTKGRGVWQRERAGVSTVSL